MRICLMIEGQEGVTWKQWTQLARTAEESGLEAMFRSDHYLGIGRGGEGGALDAWTTLAGLAAITTTLRLGSLVSPVTFRPASVLAKSVVTVDHISSGRVELGIGAGWFEPEHEAYGFEFGTARERVSLLQKQLASIVGQWTDDPRAWPKPVQEPYPHVIVGGSARRGTVEPAARFANEYNTTGVGPDECARRRGVLDEACRTGGRDPSTLPLSLMRTCVVASDEAGLRDRLGRFLDVTGAGKSVDDFLRGVGPDDLIGTVEQVAERLRAYERAGVTRVMCQHLVHEDLEMVEVLGRELRPAAA